MHGRMRGKRAETYQGLNDPRLTARAELLGLVTLSRHERRALRKERSLRTGSYPAALGELGLLDLLGYRQYQMRGGAEGLSAAAA